MRAKRRVGVMFILEAMLDIVVTVVFTIAAVNSLQPGGYEALNVVRSALLDSKFGSSGLTLRTATSSDSIYGWLSSVVVPTFFPSPSPTTGVPRVCGVYDKIGAIRIRQFRVRANVSCSRSERVAAVVGSCYGHYESATADTSPITPAAGAGAASAAAWVYSGPSPGSESSMVLGARLDGYGPSGGYSLTLAGSNATAAAAAVADLRQGRWIGPGTRGVAVEAQLLGRGSGGVLAVFAIAEVLPTGRMVATYSIKVVPAPSALSATGTGAARLDAALLALVLLSLAWRAATLAKHLRVDRSACVRCVADDILYGATASSRMACPNCAAVVASCRAHERTPAAAGEAEVGCAECVAEVPMFSPFEVVSCAECQYEVDTEEHMCWRSVAYSQWNIIDIVIQALVVATVALRFRVRAGDSSLSQSLDAAAAAPTAFTGIYPVLARWVMGHQLGAFAGLLMWLKLLRIQTQSLLVRTLSAARLELMYYFLIFFVLFVGFAFAFFLAFGSDAPAFQSWVASFIGLFQFMLGKIDFDALEASNRLLAPFYLVAFSLMVAFILANVFIAIVTAAREEQKKALARYRLDALSASIALVQNEAAAAIVAATRRAVRGVYSLLPAPIRVRPAAPCATCGLDAPTEGEERGGLRAWASRMPPLERLAALLEAVEAASEGMDIKSDGGLTVTQALRAFYVNSAVHDAWWFPTTVDLRAQVAAATVLTEFADERRPCDSCYARGARADSKRGGACGAAVAYELRTTGTPAFRRLEDVLKVVIEVQELLADAAEGQVDVSLFDPPWYDAHRRDRLAGKRDAVLGPATALARRHHHHPHHPSRTPASCGVADEQGGAGESLQLSAAAAAATAQRLPLLGGPRSVEAVRLLLDSIENHMQDIHTAMVRVDALASTSKKED